MRTDILGIGFDDLTLDEALETAARVDGGYVVTPNPEIVWLCRKDAEAATAVNGAALVLADGVGVTLASKILGRPMKARVPGIDFATAYIALLAKQGKSLFLFGGKPGIAETAGERLRADNPGLVIAGTADGYFDDDGEIVAAINSARPDFLLVCLGAPKQELWMRANAGKISARLMAGLGGALDVYAGAVLRAPERWRKAGFEWLYRLLKQPSRIKRMIKLPLFLLAVVRQRCGGNRTE